MVMGLKALQFSSVTQSCSTLFNSMDCSPPGLPVHHQLPEFTQLMSIKSVMPSNHLILCHPSNEYSGLISFRMDWLDLKALSS